MFRQIFNTFANCFKIPELRSRLFFTAVVLGVCRMISVTPIPGLDGAALADFVDRQARRSAGGDSLLGVYSLFSGGALERCSVGGLGIMPYISATIIVQLLSAVIPGLNKLAREEGGRAKLIAYGRYLTVLLCVGQGLVMALGWENPSKGFQGFSGSLVMIQNLWWYRFQTVLLLTAGTLLLMWLGEQITERGVGNGSSLIITINILSRLPLTARALWVMFFPPDSDAGAAVKWPQAFLLVGLLFAVIAGIILIQQGQRKIPVQHAQRAVGRKVFAGGTAFMPLRVNLPGVMPVIFAQAILMVPSTVFQKLGDLYKIQFLSALGGLLSERGWLYLVAFSAMVLAFSYFWVATQFNELQIADDLKKNNGYIPGVRPGQATADFLRKTMSKITLAGGVFLLLIAVVPTVLWRFLNVDYSVAQFFGGTSMLITVGVLLDTLRQMESYLVMRHYDGFLKKARVRGRN
jgi:preprotein translocase subunit SecY